MLISTLRKACRCEAPTSRLIKPTSSEFGQPTSATPTRSHAPEYFRSDLLFGVLCILFSAANYQQLGQIAQNRHHITRATTLKHGRARQQLGPRKLHS